MFDGRTLYVCNLDRNEDINEKIYKRNIPTYSFQPQFNPRPVSTKFTIMPILEPHHMSNVDMKEVEPYNIGKNFNPGSRAPWSGYAENIDCETILRNQTFALQKCDRACYVPNSDSELYNVEVKYSKQVEQPHKLLFNKNNFSRFNGDKFKKFDKIGKDFFNNPTRQQMKNR